MKKISGFLLLILSLFMLMGFFNAAPGIGFMVMFLTFVVAVGLPAAAGSFLLYSDFREKQRIKRNKQRQRTETLNAEVLKLAAHKNGKLTVVEVMSELALDDETAKEILDDLASQGLAEVELTESGVIVYSFYDLKHMQEKETARGVLDV